MTIESNPKKLLRGIEKVLDGAAGRTDGQKAAAPDGHGDGMMRSTILCIDDDPNLLAMRRKLLESAGYRVLTAQSGAEGIKVFAAGFADAVILDYIMPLMNGGAVAAAMRQIDKDVRLVLHSGCSEIPKEDWVLFDRVIPKGVSPDVLISAIQQLLLEMDRKSAQPRHAAGKRRGLDRRWAGSAANDQSAP